MDVVLGVAVADRIARLTLVEAAAQGQDVIDQSVVDLADNPIQTLTDTVVGTNRLLADENHRLSATRLWWSDPQRVDELRRALEDSGVQNVVVLDESEAATAMAHDLDPSEPEIHRCIQQTERDDDVAGIAAGQRHQDHAGDQDREGLHDVGDAHHQLGDATAKKAA